MNVLFSVVLLNINLLTYALLLIYMTGYLSTCKYIALSASFGYNVCAAIDVSFRALNAMHSATGAVGSLQGPGEMGSR